MRVFGFMLIISYFIWAHLDEGHEHLVTDKDHQKGKYLDTSEGSTIFLWKSRHVRTSGYAGKHLQNGTRQEE